LKHFLRGLTANILKWLAPLGPWGMLATAVIDSGSVPLPIDAILAGYVYRRPEWFLIFPLMAAAGSALGSLVIYGIGLKGEEMLLEKRISKSKLEKIRDRFERQEFFAVMIPAILPPPTPIKLFMLSAGAFRMKLRDFLLAMFTGRLIRFLLLAIVVHYFGPEIVHVMGEAFHQHLVITIAIILVVVILIAFVLLRRPAAEIVHELEHK